jgi:hypothetical protein
VLPADFDDARVQADVAWLVEEVGPRPFRSAAAAAAAAGVAARLDAAGWPAQEVGLPGNLLACRGGGGWLLLAHTDSVPGSPGAVDNAGAVAMLVELARVWDGGPLCLGFPVGEEAGLVGSTEMAAAWSAGALGPAPAGVLSLELLGQGEPTLMGLSRAWDARRLDWLAGAWRPLPPTPFGHLLYSRLLPDWERSDHAPFAAAGLPALLLLGRGPARVFVDYHQPSDRVAGAAPLRAAAARVAALVRAGPPPPAAAHAAATLAWPVAGGVVPAPVTAGVLGAGAVASLAHARRWRSLPRLVGRGLLGAALATALSTPLVLSGWLPTHPAERTAAAVMGVPAVGWWEAAPFALALGIVGFLAVRRALGPRGSAPLLCGVGGLGAALVDPLLALPFAAGALLSHLHPLFGVAPAIYLLRPDALRELAFHGLIPPVAWGLLWLLAIPAMGSRTDPRPEPPR